MDEYKDTVLRQSLALGPCNPIGSFDDYGQDNCFFGRPAVMDRTLQSVGARQPGVISRRRVASEAGRRSISRWTPEKLIGVAASLDGHGTGTACYLDTLRYLFASA